MTTIEIWCAIIGAVAVVLGGMWFIINRAVNSGIKEHRLGEVEQKTKHADCMNNKSDIGDIKRWIMKFDNGMIDAFSAKKSPRQITPIGLIIIEASGANQIMQQIGGQLIEQLEQRGVSTAFDVETEAYFAVLRNDHHEAYNALKSYIYNQPEEIDVTTMEQTQRVRLDYDAILRAVSLSLRDAYLDKHPEITE